MKSYITPYKHCTVYILTKFCSCCTGGASGNGTGVVWSTRVLDREERKEYHIPIIIQDSGTPTMSGTSTLTVVVGDVNDNPMYGGRKSILVYNYMVIGTNYITCILCLLLLYVFEVQVICLWTIRETKVIACYVITMLGSIRLS